MREPVITFSQNLVCSSKTIGYLEEDDDNNRSSMSVEGSDIVHVNK